jgi:RimJ/RimL family protein N-acetyltransferase
MYRHKNGLTLSKIDTEDLEALKSLKDESWFGTHTVSIINHTDQKRWFDNTKILVLKATMLGKSDMMGIFKIDNLNTVNRICDVGWDVMVSFRGRGLGKYLVEAGVDFCFEILNVNRLNAEILENNIASQKCALAASFVQEGNKRKSVYKCGEYLDSYMYGILGNEWLASKKERYGDSVCNNSYVPKDTKASGLVV